MSQRTLGPERPLQAVAVWHESLEAFVEMNDAGCFQDGAAGARFEAGTPDRSDDGRPEPRLGGRGPGRVTLERLGRRAVRVRPRLDRPIENSISRRINVWTSIAWPCFNGQR